MDDTIKDGNDQNGIDQNGIDQGGTLRAATTGGEKLRLGCYSMTMTKPPRG